MILKRVAKAIMPKALWSIAQTTYYDIARRFFKKKVTAHLYGTSTFLITIADPTAQQWYDHDCPLPLDLSIAKSCLPLSESVIFDLGAHQSVIAMMIATEVAPRGHVVAVEANANNHAIGEENVRQNGKNNMTLINAMIGAASGTGFISRDPASHVARARSFGSNSVPMICIDDLTSRFGKPGMLYIDVEGFEAEALRGAEATLHSRPFVFIELHGDEMIGRYGSSNSEVAAMLLERNYSLYVSADESTYIALRSLSDLPFNRCFLLAVPEGVKLLKPVDAVAAVKVNTGAKYSAQWPGSMAHRCQSKFGTPFVPAGLPRKRLSSSCRQYHFTGFGSFDPHHAWQPSPEELAA